MTPDELYALLPTVHRRRDEEEGGPLRALLAVVAEQVAVLQEDIERLYDNWFIETCDDWVVPYIGDLVGYEILPGIAAALSDDTSWGTGLSAVVVPRRDVADTVVHRRRKGTLPLLEDLSSAVAGWPARVVEHRRLLCVTQSVRRLTSEAGSGRHGPAHGGLVDLRSPVALDRLGGPFDEFARTLEVPRPGSARRSGRYGIRSVGLHVWRLRPYSVTRAPAYCLDRDRACYTFNVLAIDTPLFTAPVPEPSSFHVADETNVPGPLSRRAFAERPDDYYGPHRSLCVWTGPDEPVPLDRIVSADLTGWHYRPRAGQVAIDPVLGRLMLPPGTAGAHGVRVTYHYAFSGDLGGGEYPRPEPAPADSSELYRVGPGGDHHSIAEALEHWQAAKRAHPRKAEAIMEFTSNDVWAELDEIRLDAGDRLTLRAADGVRPVVRLRGRYGHDRGRALTITGPGSVLPSEVPARIVLDGLLVTGGCVRVRGGVDRLVIRHCTFVPGWELESRGTPLAPGAPSLDIAGSPVRTEIRHSVLGAITVAGRSGREPNRVDVCDSVLDATSHEATALGSPDGSSANVVLTARSTTVIGSVRARAADLLENCLLQGEVRIDRCDRGAVRFCWLPPGSLTPPRFHCQPEHSEDEERVVLRFATTRYGRPDYVRLADTCAEEIRRGGDNGSEPGVWRHLFEPQRQDNLRTRLAEYTPAGCDAGVFFAT
ncbi:hypothetical protein Stsp02_19860 [Streptomyces sp. NBRC 14336]|uniref:hypothetical protein n=1 Tax=Streptomyces sp. NBRC 14336 TaxID=3030992 RepID=UPI00249FD608|nr:hypothetical protein [Streptomyces sp. NBRC 14336]GLW46324.1 hypothetical protein Stsp02_19860 [Streptomyces sp. NBRC 14336]